MKNLRAFTLSDMCQCEIRRTGHVAEIIIDKWEDELIRLMGFQTDAAMSDFEIYEQWQEYLKAMIKELTR